MAEAPPGILGTAVGGAVRGALGEDALRDHAPPATIPDAARFVWSRLCNVWHARPPQQRRAVLFLTVFLLLVLLSLPSSLEAGAPVVRSPGFGVALSPHGLFVADVHQFAFAAVADNDGEPAGPAPTKAEQPAMVGAPAGVTPTSTAAVTGKLAFDPQKKRWSIEWTGSVQRVEGMVTVGGRGMELSTLQYWRNGRLYACDDRSGIVYELTLVEGASPKAVPRFIIPDGNGDTPRGMRCEWSTVKGDYLMLGSAGKPWTDVKRNEVISSDPLWIKAISPDGEVRHIDWTEQYEKLRGAFGVSGTGGYVVHECAAWSAVRRQWVFIPRRVSPAAYDPADESKRGSNAMLFTDASFSSSRVVPLPPMGASDTEPGMGVTECKFLPNGKDDLLVLVKSGKGADGKYVSRIAIVGVDGRLVLDEEPMPEGWQFEGLALRPIVHVE